MPDPIGAIAALSFIAAGLAIIPIADWLDHRQQRLAARRRSQAHRRRLW